LSRRGDGTAREQVEVAAPGEKQSRTVAEGGWGKGNSPLAGGPGMTAAQRGEERAG